MKYAASSLKVVLIKTQLKFYKLTRLIVAYYWILDKDDMKELGVSALGDRKKLHSIIAKLKKHLNSPTSHYFVHCMPCIVSNVTT